MTDTAARPNRPRLDAWALLALRNGRGDVDWGAIRATQLAVGHSLALFLFAANVIGAALVVDIYAHAVPTWQLACWGAGVAAIALIVAFRRLAARTLRTPSASIGDIRDTALEGIALGTIWTIPALGFSAMADRGAALGLFVIMTLMMTAFATAMAALPLAAVTFQIVCGSAVAAMVLVVADPVSAAATLVLAALLAVISIGRGMALAGLRVREIAISERDETVSLLLRESEEEAADWLWEIDAARRIVRASPRFVRSLALDPSTVDGTPFLQALAGSRDSGDLAPALHTLAAKLKAREAFRELLVPVVISEEQRWWEIAAKPRFGPGGHFCGYQGVGSDVTEQRASAEKISRMARYDALTALPNRLLIEETLGKALAAARQGDAPCAFMMIDLDRFKAVNDTLGHPIGDRLLVQVAERLAGLMTADDIVGRLGGDEFVVVVRDATDTARVEALAHMICERLSQPYEIDRHTLYIGASVGLATGPRDGATTDTLIRSADLALYRSKDAGRGGVRTYEPQLHVEAEERRVLEMALRGAMAAGELHLVYQPVVDAGTGALTGFEALLRWTSPIHGPVPPTTFVPLAEDARLIAPIGEWVLRTACDEAARWQAPVRIAVNVSPEQLQSPRFVGIVASALANSGLAPERLELEVTEGVFLREGTGAIQVLEQVLELGVRLTLDDFGTGHSALGYLSRTRFSSIKIDRRFVTDAAGGVREAVAIVRAAVALADSLGMATTAEGVETDQQHVMMQRFGCTKVQGYLFGRPLPVLEARALATRARAAAA